MAITSLTLTPNNPPFDIGTTETATIAYNTSGSTPYRFQVFAQEVDGAGNPVGSAESISGTASGAEPGGGGGSFPITLNVTALDPAKNYVFYAQDNLSGFESAEVAVDVTCFAAGTLILTARGEVRVEDLRIGDLVVTAEGGAALKPIRWIGHTRVNLARHPDRARAAPIVITAGALAEGVPARDLRVSPEHAMLLDGRLVPAHLLVNGVSIVQELWCREVTYYHVELDSHGLLVSEGAVSESYFDDGNRKLFDNHPVTVLIKDFLTARVGGRYSAEACRPVLLDGPGLDQLRARLVMRAASMRLAMASAPVAQRA